MISKELLSEVLEIKVFTEIREDDDVRNNILVYWEFDGYHNECRNINIYELAHKCKEWAIGEYGFSLHSFPCPDDTYTCEIYKFHKSTGYAIVDWFNCLSEVESIFKACQWILDNKESK